MSQNEEGQILNGMRTRQYYFLQPLTSNIERVEVIKRPGQRYFFERRSRRQHQYHY